MPTQTATTLRDGEPFFIGRWLVEPTLNRLTLGETSIQLEHKAMDVLICLVEHAGEVVSKNDLLDAVWQTEFVSDNTLQGRIAEIRDALGDNAQNPTFIETIRKRGYRLIAEIGIPELDRPAPGMQESPPQPDDERNPYPGLAAFTEADAEVFFGREKEIAALWRKITSRKLLAVIGPSGIGKSSLLRAGVATRAPPGWRVLVFTPGEGPAMSLARALAPDHAGDPSAVSRLVGFGDRDTALAVVSRWRGQFAEVVLVVDQFEELFTLNQPEVQSEFIELLRRLVDAADVHVVLAMRDDFLFQCEAFSEIAPVFDGLTPLGAPNAEALRRAITEPAARLLHRFESEILVDRMIAEVEDQRGALPLLAFAVRRLWEKRDQENRVLTEEAYDTIGGVAGALARHAEAIMGEIGHERLSIVREIFRNLVTAEGTRAVREVDELLSVFDDNDIIGAGRTPARDAALEVLHKLIDARLLTSFETHDDEELSTRRVEIVHESLLANWPRLVRWQTQDADAAQLRDQLRQAARTWDEHQQTKDYLWTGRAYREFDVWRESYPGGLTVLEEEFAEAMTSNSKRRKRRRRVAVAAFIAVLLAVLVVVGSLWRRSERETRRAEAQKLFALAKIELENDRTAALALTIKSLELADDSEARKLAIEALWNGPQKFIIDNTPSWLDQFTPDGSNLVRSMETNQGPQLEVLNPDGSTVVLDRVHDFARVNTSIAPDGDLFASWGWSPMAKPTTVALWTMSSTTPAARRNYKNPVDVRPAWNGSRLLLHVAEDGVGWIDALGEDGSSVRLGPATADFEKSAIDEQTGRWFATIQGDEVMLLDIGNSSLGQHRSLGRHRGASRIRFHPRGDFLITSTPGGEIRFWNPHGPPDSRVLLGPKGLTDLSLFSDGSVLAAYTRSEGKSTADVWYVANGPPRFLRRYEGDVPFSELWDPVGRRFLRFVGGFNGPALLQLSAPPEAEPIPIVDQCWGLDFHPSGDWLSTADQLGSHLWHISRPFAVTIARLPQPAFDLEFERNGRFLAVAGGRNRWVRLWPLEGDVLNAAIVRAETGEWGHAYGVAISPDSRQLLVSGYYGVALMSVDPGPVHLLDGYRDAVADGVFSPSGALVAAPGGGSSMDSNAVHVWNAVNGRHIRAIDAGSKPRWDLIFLSEERLLAATETGLVELRLDEHPRKLLHEGGFRRLAANVDKTRAILLEGDYPAGGPERALAFDITTNSATPLSTHGIGISAVAIDTIGEIAVTGNLDGEIRIGPMTGEEPHLLLGHEGGIAKLAMDPLGRWIVSAGEDDNTVRLWPMPDLTKPPLHTLPREELIAKLKTLTNLRVVRDPVSSTGWKLTHDPFPGWETVPTW